MAAVHRLRKLNVFWCLRFRETVERAAPLAPPVPPDPLVPLDPLDPLESLVTAEIL